MDTLESKLWIPSKELVWELATIQALADEEGKVVVQTIVEPKRTVTIKKSETHLLDESHLLSLDDVCLMNNLNEGALLQMLNRRLMSNQIYTYSSDVLISVNPYAHIPGLYDDPLRYSTQANDDDDDDDGKDNAADGTAAVSDLIRRRAANLPPHVYEIAQNALRELTRERRPLNNTSASRAPTPVSQSIIVSGESGAGKTEASKHAMAFLIKANEARCALVEMARGDGSMSDLGNHMKEVLLQSSVAFESFGNSKTVRNDNSSRFGKYIKLQYSQEHLLVSAVTETFLLEKSRLVAISRGERNYHVFYQMLSHLDTRTALRLGSAKDFRILVDADGQVDEKPAAEDKEGFVMLCKALEALGCSQTELTALWSLLASLLHLGNITCKRASDNDEDACEVNCSSTSLDELSAALGVPSTSFLLNLRTQTLQAAKRTSVSKKVLSPEDTQNSVFALLKFIYKGVFEWLLQKVNVAHSTNSLSTPTPSQSQSAALKYCGILDIFGFEILQTNSFEQLCINFTNERLQQQFNEHIFVLEQEEYAAEGLDWSRVSYRDNQSVIELIGKKPGGLLLILEEHSLMNRKPDDKALGNSFATVHGKAPNAHPAFSKSRFGGNEAFVVKHFAGEVSYELEGFISKNNDSLQEDLQDLLSISSNSLLRAATGLGFVESHEVGFLRSSSSSSGSSSSSSDSSSSSSGANTAVEVDEPESADGKKMASAVTVSHHFRKQLDVLVATLKTTAPHYIKCIKSNATKSKTTFSCPLVMEQLRYSGIIEVVRIRREGYPCRMSYKQFYAKHQILSFARGWVKFDDAALTDAQAREYTKALANVELLPNTFQFGNSRVFLMDGCLDVMQKAILRFLSSYAVKIQALWCGLKQRQRYLVRYAQVVRLQAALRMLTHKQKFRKYVFDKKVAKAAIEAERRRLEAIRLREEEEKRDQERLAKMEHAARVAAIAEAERVREERRKLEASKASILQQSFRQLIMRRQTAKKVLAIHKAVENGDLAFLKKASAKDLGLLHAEPGVHCHWPIQFTAVRFNQVGVLNQFGWSRPAGLSAQSVLSMRDGRGNTALHISCSAIPLQETTIVAICEACDALIPPTPTAGVKAKVGADKMLVSSNTSRSRTEPLKSGWLSKRKDGNAWRRRWCVLTEDQLVYYKTPQDSVPKGIVPLLGCTFRRVTGPTAEGPSFELRSPHIKKSSFFGLGGQQIDSPIYFLAETEADLLQWISPTRAVLGVETLRQGKITYADNAKRGRVLNASALNHKGETALHLLAAQRHKGTDQEQADLLTTAAWVVSLGCLADRKALDGKSPAEVARENSHPSLSDFLIKATAESFSTEVLKGMLARPTFYKGYSYLQLTFLTHSMVGGATPRFQPLAQPTIAIDVLSADPATAAPGSEPVSLEASQSLLSPFYCHVNGSTLWWGHVFYLQNPLENFDDGACVRMRVLPPVNPSVYPPQIPTPISEAILTLSKKSLDSGRVVLECLPVFASAGGQSKSKPRPHSLLHVEVSLLFL